jgi:predicted O-methyltransferase YrrM
VDPALRQFLDELYDRGRAHDEHEPDRLRRYRNLEPDTARLLAVLIRAFVPHRLLELGTSNGYSTIWLADAARAVGGTLVSVDIDPGRSQEAHTNLAATGLEDVVELRVEDAAATLAQAADGSWDFILLDAERPFYVGYWPDLVRTLRPSGLLVVDNVISHASELMEFRNVVESDGRVADALCPVGAGALLVVRITIEPSSDRQRRQRQARR